jgi:hypothetical protein
MFQNTRKNHFGSKAVQWIHLVQNHFPNSGTQNSAFMLDTQVLQFLHSKAFQNALKHSQTSIYVQGIRMDAFGRK